MCEIKSFEDLLEKFNAEEVAEHLNSCSECRKTYGKDFAMIYPDIPFERINYGKKKEFSIFFKIIPAAIFLSIALIIGIFFWQNQKNINQMNGYSNSITYSDCLDIMDSLNDDKFIEIINKVQEEL